MKILMTCVPFFPKIGGVGIVTDLVARGLTRLGHEVTVVTLEAGDISKDPFIYSTLRCPTKLQLYREYRRAKVCIAHGPALQLIWPALFTSTPTIVIHHQIVDPVRSTFRRLFFQAIAARTRHYAVSDIMVANTKFPLQRILNPFDDEIYHANSKSKRGIHELLFVGRLIPEKGIFDLLNACKALNQKGIDCSLTIVGDGSGRREVERISGEGVLAGKVKLLGELMPKQVAAVMQDFQLLVVPSNCGEAFGLVAIEGIACGNVVVGTNDGGLPEAVGECGVIVERGNSEALVGAIGQIMTHPEEVARLRSKANLHLERYRSQAVAQQYQNIAEAVCRRK